MKKLNSRQPLNSGWLTLLILLGFLSTTFAADRSQRVAVRKGKWFAKMDFGPALGSTIGYRGGAILKGQAVRLGSDEAYTAIYDTKMMSFNGAMPGFLKLEGTPWDGRHGGYPNCRNSVIFSSSMGPGWAKNGSFKDPRKKPFGPLPKEWSKYKGQYRNGDTVVLSYTVGSASVFEMPAFESVKGVKAITRTLNIPQANEKMTAMIIKGAGKNAAILGQGKAPVTIAVIGEGLKLRKDGDNIVADIAAGTKNISAKVVMAFEGDLNSAVKEWPAAGNLSEFTKGGPLQWPGKIAVKGNVGADRGPYSTDEIPLPPSNNPWSSSIRFSGFDFFSNGTSAAICSWNGDVWVVTGIDDKLENLKWKRYAAGLFETLGVKIVDDVVYVTGKDQITRLHDLNKDGEADYYENFNNDIMITTNFHEFTFDLQTDKEGNFYFAKGAPVRAGGRGFSTTHENHGVVFKVSKDGSSSEVVGNGIRAPGGLGVGPNGEITTGENEGTYVPACKINWVTKGSFSGVIHPGNGRTMEQGYDNPLCWLPMYVDNSGGGQVWVDNDKWGPFNGDLLHLSYGRSKVYKVMKQDIEGGVQGGVFELPIMLTSSAMRGRFNPVDKQLYVAGFRGWQTNAAKESALQRVRYNGKKVATPKEMKVTKEGVYITFTQKLDKELAEDKGSYSVKWWNYLWSPQYGSAHFSVNNPDKKAIEIAMKKETKAGGTRGADVAKPAFAGDDVPVASAKLMEDGKTVFLKIPGIRPVMQMEIKIDVETTDGDEIITKVYNSIYKLADK
ncbi:MAG: hypothetical protein NE327_11940 [Lentisphaeraceae bacterium]|nr:hypothetical protein [Lentisphaeraceae bacterium]